MRNLTVSPAWRARAPFPLALLLPLLLAFLVGPVPLTGQNVGPTAYAGMRWRSIGPNRSGNVYAVAGVSGDAAVYYLGLPEGGVWKTTSGGTTWEPIFDEIGVASIGAVVVAPSNPDVVYVGTGDPSGWSFTPGNGVYRSTDAGKTWTHLGLDSTRYITDMLVDPKDPNVVLVGVLGSRQRGGEPNPAAGVYRSTDGGMSWTKVLELDGRSGVTGLKHDDFDPLIAYASVQRTALGRGPGGAGRPSPTGAGIFKSTDGGVTWTAVPGKGLPDAPRGFEIAVASGTHGRRVYAEARGTGRDAGGLYRSDDGGATWTLGTRRLASAGGRIYADPTNPNIVYLMGTSIYRSVDGGRTFASYKGSPGGDDERDMWIDPHDGDHVIVGADQGPTISLDGGRTWTPWYNLINGQFYNVSTDYDFPYRVCGAQQDSGTACVDSRSDWGEITQSDWQSASGFEAGFIVADPIDHRYVYSQGWYHVLRRLDRETGQVAVLYSPTPEDHFGGSPPMVLSPQDPHTLYMGAQWLMVSSDGARTWRHISPDLTLRPGMRAPTPTPGIRFRAPFIQTISPSAVAGGEIWVGTSTGLVQLTRDGGQHWTDVTPATMPQGAVNIVDASHRDAGTAYAAIQTPGDDAPFVLRTRDYGRSWEKITTGLPRNAGVRVVREDPGDANLLYAGTVKGAWVSFDQGDHWQSLQLNLPTTVVTDMTVHGSDLAISTYGRGLWILDDVTPLRQVRAALSSRAAYLFEPDTAWRVRWDNYQDTPLPPEVPHGDNPPEGAILDYYLPRAASGTVTLSIYDAEGGLVRTYTSVAPAPDTTMANVPSYWIATPTVLPTSAGMHRVAWDLRYETPPALNYAYSGGLLDYTEFTLTWHAIEGRTPRWVPTGPIVVPGTYRVELSVAGERSTRVLAIRNDPRESISQADLEDQLAFERRMMAGMAASYHGFNALQSLRDALATAMPRLRASAAKAATALDDRAAELSTGDTAGFGTANRDLGRHLEDMEFGDVKPTESDLAAAELDCKQIDGASAGLQALITKDIPRMNAMLIREHLPELPAVQAPSSPACTVGSGSIGR